MNYIKKLLGKMPLSKKRRRTARAVERLWRDTPLGKADRQSEGALYDYFLRNDRNDIYKWHHYFDVYEHYLARFIGTPFRFLEIGVLRGGSQRMWRDYFGAGATIVGIDIDRECAKLDGCHGAVRIGDQTDEGFLDSVRGEFGPFDVVIDDGGHEPSQQIQSFSYLYPNVTENGVYIVEDTQTSFWPSRRDLGGKLTFVNLALEAATRLSEPHFERRMLDRYAKPPGERPGEVTASRVAATTHGVHFHDSMIVFEKREKSEPWHEIR